MPDTNDTTKQPIHFAIFNNALDKLNAVILNGKYHGYWRQSRDVYSIPSGDEWQHNKAVAHWYVSTTMFTRQELIDICEREQIAYRDSGAVFIDGLMFLYEEHVGRVLQS